LLKDLLISQQPTEEIMILSALALSAALSMPNFALWIEVTNHKTKEVKNYHTALNFKPDALDTIFKIPLHGTKKKIPIQHLEFMNHESGNVTWSWAIILLKKPLVAVKPRCFYDSSRGYKPKIEGPEAVEYKDHNIFVHCYNPKD
jgi:hypothetical protein